MRLTLRTLLAHQHGLLNEQQAELISQKIEQSPFVAQLLRHLKDRAARREIVPLAIEARGTVCLEKVTRYLDYTLPSDEVVKLENECFASDRLLAEVASCHEIISQWLSTPTPTEPALRQRLYAIIPGPIGSIADTGDELAIELPALAYQSAPPSKPLAEKAVSTPPTPAKSGWIGGAFQLSFLAASVLALVTFVAINRDKVESIIAQHWQAKSQTDSELQDVRPLPLRQQPPETLVFQDGSVSQIESALSKEEVPALLPEVATTAFHVPVPANQAIASVTRWNVESAKGTLVKGSLEETWHAGNFQQLDTGRVVVVPGGQLRVNLDGLQLEVGQLSEIYWNEDSSIRLRYGSCVLSMELGQELTLKVADQRIKVAASNHPVRLAVSTKAVASRGLDFASTTENQEVQFQGISGEAVLTIPGCRGPIPLGDGQMIIANMNSGVRGGEKSIMDESSEMALPDAMQLSNEPVRWLKDSLSSGGSNHRLDAAMALAQLGHVDAWSNAWCQLHDRQVLEQHFADVQRLVAQDSSLAGELKSTLAEQNREYASLIYRLICGFSDDQLTDETRTQLETLLRHPEPAVQAWAQFQLSQQQIR
ncbi:hypothetical protein C5Y96_08865 [Blastopirellula marina]|uniref:Uncharacterized protein n=1 Tax=Blastopirellula marina TaxID=124 RepID=A0A2S8FUD0_9BACT|nr:MULTISPECIES: hypothetical protein [Pirellulaceae]PQO35753.1 hypothetical protein C5Y96_08865 [Blastopirellula marina]RCS53327.1 hypothetical protein DTL36_08875 [Bremerella cremea]